MPEGLTGAAYEAWQRIVPMLLDRKVLTPLDSAALGLLCRSLADYERLCAEISVEGEVYSTTTGTGDEMRRPNPKCNLRDQAERSMRASLADFGLNPSARSRLQIGEPGPKVNKFASLGKEGR